MFIPRTDDERDLLLEIAKRFGGAARGAAPHKPVGELVPLTDREYQNARSAIAAQVEPLKEAYKRGMAVAQTDEQRDVLDALRQILGPPRDG